IPSGWQVQSPLDPGTDGNGRWEALYRLVPIDHRPRLIRWVYPGPRERAAIVVHTIEYKHRLPGWKAAPDAIRISDATDYPYTADRAVDLDELKFWSAVHYERTNKRDFNRTYRQICNSLTIE